MWQTVSQQVTQAWLWQAVSQVQTNCWADTETDGWQIHICQQSPAALPAGPWSGCESYRWSKEQRWSLPFWESCRWRSRLLVGRIQKGCHLNPPRVSPAGEKLKASTSIDMACMLVLIVLKRSAVMKNGLCSSIDKSMMCLCREAHSQAAAPVKYCSIQLHGQ